MKMRLKELRKAEGKTQSDIAKLLNVAQTSYGGYELETSEPTIDTLCKLADYYKVSLDYLVGRENASDVGYLSEQDRSMIKVFKSLDEVNKIKVASYALGLLAAQE